MSTPAPAAVPARWLRAATRVDAWLRGPAARGHAIQAARAGLLGGLVWAAVNGPLHALGWTPVIDGWAALGLVFVPRVWRLVWEQHK